MFLDEPSGRAGRTHSLTHSLTHSKSRAGYARIEKARAPASIYGFSCKQATDGAAREEPSLLVLFRVATEVDRRSREAAVFLCPT